MPEDVAEVTPEKSPAPATSLEDENATLKRKLATLEGQSQALAREKEEKARIAKELDELSRWKAEREKEDMSEVDRLQLAVKEAQAERETAIAAVQREKFTRLYPLAVAEFGDQALPPEDVLARLNEKFAKATAETVTPEPPVDRNLPQRSATLPAESEMDTIDREIARMGQIEMNRLAGKD